MLLQPPNDFSEILRFHKVLMAQQNPGEMLAACAKNLFILNLAE